MILKTGIIPEYNNILFLWSSFAIIWAEESAEQGELND